MKCQVLFTGKNKKTVSNCHLLKFLPRVLSIKSLHERLLRNMQCRNGFSRTVSFTGKKISPLQLVAAVKRLPVLQHNKAIYTKWTLLP